jgi:hypothetical protein
MMEVTNTTAIIGAAIALAIALTKIIEGLTNKFMGKKSLLSNEERGWIKSMYELSHVRDSNGVPRIYSPLDWTEIQKNFVSSLNKIAITQEKTAWVLESIGKQLERISQKIDKQID